MKKDFLSISDLLAEEIWQVIFLAIKLKQELGEIGRNRPFLEGKNMVMIFEKPSLRTKLSFDMAMNQLGGHAVCFGIEEVGLGKREEIKDAARVVSSMADVVMARTFLHKSIEELATYSKVPVINGLSDLEHPCQILADLMTIYEIKGKLEGLKLAFVGDGENNVTHSLALASGILGMDFVCASPNGYGMNQKVYEKVREIVYPANIKSQNFSVTQITDPYEALKDADVVYTDTWVSMGDEKEKEKRNRDFKDYQVTSDLMKHAKEDAIFMHDMPVYRGSEVSVEVIDGPQSVIYQQAENRLHAQKGLLVYLLVKEKYDEYYVREMNYD